MSLLGTGILGTLLILGLSNKGSYGRVPVDVKGLSHYFADAFSSDRTEFETAHPSKINSLFVKDDGSGPTAMIILVAHNDDLTDNVQRITNTKQIPLVFSVSTLPFKEAEFEPYHIEFEQNNKIWQPQIEGEYEIFPLSSEGKFGGTIHDGEIHQGVVMLPDWFDVHRPIIIRYFASQRMLRF